MVTVLEGGIAAAILVATSSTATVTFTFNGSVCPPISVSVFGFQQATSRYVLGNALGLPEKVLSGASAFSSFSAATNTMILGLTKNPSTTGATSGLGQVTHCIVQFILSK